jgi:hypothetical protein
MEFRHKIQVGLLADGTLVVRHTAGTEVPGAGKDPTEVVECHRSVPVGGPTAEKLKKLLGDLITINKEAMETLCGRDARLTAYVTTIKAASAGRLEVTGIDVDHNPEEEEDGHAEPGPDGGGEGGGGGDADGDRTPRTPPVGRRKPR